jgi:hypothetical protein
VWVEHGDGDEQAGQPDPGAGGFLVGGAQGTVPVGGVAGGLVAALGAAQRGPERGGVDLLLDDPGGLPGGQGPVEQGDPFRIRAGADQPGQHVVVHLLAGGFVPGPADRGAAVVAVAVPALFGGDRPAGLPVQIGRQRQPGGGGEHPGDVAAGGRVVGGADDADQVGRAGPAEQGQAAAGQPVLQPGQGAGYVGDRVVLPGGGGGPEGDRDPGVHVGGRGGGGGDQLAEDVPGGGRRGGQDPGRDVVGQPPARVGCAVDGDGDVPDRW